MILETHRLLMRDFIEADWQAVFAYQSDPLYLRQQGYKALIDALGVAGTLRFLQQLEECYGDYTKEHHQWLDQLTINDFRNYIK
ncbi:hypothetical protein [Nostoc sp.]|uniref:hypothetical protein n=1 Tax=Nostoc sp. TaxID=1180 RepID=UPI002FF77A2E